MKNKKSILSYGIKQGIARKLIVYLLIFSSIITLFLTSIQLYLEYDRDIKQIVNHMGQIENTHLKTISTGLWSFDEIMLKAELEGLLHVPDMQYVEIKPNSGESLSIGKYKQSNVIRKEYPLSFFHKGKQIPVGTLLVDFTLSEVYDRLIGRVAIILLSQSIKTFLVSIFIFFIFYFLVTKDLNTVADYVSGFDFTKLNTELKLNRKQNKIGANDELDHLVSGINKMRTNLLHDITKRKQVEEKLRRSEKDLNASQEIARLGSWRLDLATNEVFWTEELYKMYGFDPSIPPPPYTEHMKLFTPESWDILSTSLAKTSETGMPYELELETVNSDGGHGWMWVRGEAVKNSEGEIIKLWGAAQDITKRKLETERYKKTIESSLDGFWIVGMKGNLLEVNEAYSNMIGYKRDELLTMSIKDIEAKEEPGETENRIKKIVKTGSDRFESKHRHKQGHIIDVEVSASFTQDNGGLFFVFLRDITERNQMEIQIRQAQKMESIGNLAGGIAHDFNNILFPIIGMSEMLIEDLPPGSIEKENAEEIYRAGQRASDLVKQILAFSRQTEHKMIPTRIQNILKEVLKLTRATIPAYIEISQDIQQDCGTVLADPSQIHQISMNIITNAYHAVEDTGGKISIHLRQTVLEPTESIAVNPNISNYAVLSISDSGHGMSEELIGNIFDPYFTTKEQGKGTGLGLAVVYGLVKEHKGDIKVTSEIGNGSTFTVYLPLMERPEGVKSIDKLEVYQGGTERILLIDDEEPVAKLEKQMLERMGYKVTLRLHSIEALEAFKTSPFSFDLVVTDMSMPNMPGDQLAGKLKSIRPDVPIIICTGFSERLNEDNFKRMGIDGLLMKPIIQSDLAQMVRKVLDETKGSTHA